LFFHHLFTFDPHMIHWLLQSFTDHPKLGRGEAPVGVLSLVEQQRFSALRVPKRRADWLLGRWTAKRLVQAYCARVFGQRPPLDKLVIGRIPGTAAPMAAIDHRFAPVDSLPVRSIPLVGPAGKRSDPASLTVDAVPLPVSLSISHAADRAFCALVEQRLGTAPPLRDVPSVGADIESVEPRSRRFVDDFFTVDEIELVSRAPEESFDLLATAVWSAKEAVLKALRLGLTVDTRRVSCLPGWPDAANAGDTDKPARLFGPQEPGWLDVAVRYDSELPDLDSDLKICAWWRPCDGYVLTLATVTAKD
jgi:4'-phosphopantetheinyl transferase